MINEIWEGLRLLLFFSSPKRGFYGGKRGFRILATRRPTPGQGWPLLLLRTSRRPCRQAGPHGPPRRPGPGLSPLRRCLAPWMGPNEKGMRAALQSSDWPPATPRRASAAGGLVVAEAGGVRPGPSRAAVVCVGRLRRPPENRGRQPPAQVVGIKGPGLRGAAGRPPCGLKPSPRGGCVVVGGVSAAPGGAGSPWPALARPRLGGCNWLAGGPQRPGGRDGRGPLSGARAVVLFGLVPCRRRSGPRFSGRAGQR